MSVDRLPIEPIRTYQRLHFLDEKQLEDLQEATLHILENTGVKFPSEKALSIFAEHGASVDYDTQIVKIAPELLDKYLATSPRTGVPAHTRAQLLQQLAPSRHGLIISARERGALFLPVMWKQLPDPEDFVDHLFEKAGLPESPWPANLQAEVFTTESFTRHLSGMTTARP